MSKSDMSSATSNNNTKIVFLIIAAAAAVGLLFALRPGDKPVADSRPVEPPPQRVVEPPPPPPAPPPAPVQEKAAVVEHQAQPEREVRLERDPPPPPPPPKVEETKKMREVLMGTKKKGGIAEMAERAEEAKEERAAQQKARARRRQQEEEDEFVDSMERSGLGLSDAQFYATMEKWRGVKSCLATGTTRNDEVIGEPKGALRISLKINGAGEVTDSRVFEPSNDVAKLIAPCVERSAKQIKFPALSGNVPMVTKTAKFVF